jgi:hypothetical protein
LIFIPHYLYRKSTRRAIATLLAVFLPLTFAFAQVRAQTSSSAKKSKRGPRAIAVVEFLPGGAMRLVPIALWIEGRYYDASLYGASPEPMAIEPQTVYEAQSLGEPTGTFTITEPRQINGSWIADGTWQPHLAMDAKTSAQAAKDAALKAKSGTSRAVLTGDDGDGRPVLKRAPGSGSTAADASRTAPTSTPSASTGDSDRPVMKKPATDSSGKPTMGSTDEPPATTSSAKTQTVDDKDPNRPVFKRPPAPAAQPDTTSANPTSSTVTATAASSDDNDPNRPVLSRTKGAKPTAPIAQPAVTKPGAASPGATKATRAYPAISDAGQYESRPLLYSMSSGERQVQEEQLLKLAMEEIRAFAAKRNGPPIPKTAVITDYDVRAFDLEFSNSPTVVLTARLPVAGVKVQRDLAFNYYVSIVARVDINDVAQKIFLSVTDSNHLDAFPRMELIDALDADANGRGDLLFRQYSDTGISYGLYRVSPYQIEKIFEGGSSL